MVVGGIPSSSNNDVEVINLSGDGRTCDKPANNPVKKQAVGTFFDGYPLVCGGVKSKSSDKCYKYNVQVGTHFNHWYI